MTVRHLLQHSAGWDRDVAGDAVFWRVPPPAGVKVTSPRYNAHLLQYVLNRKLQFTPGICLKDLYLFNMCCVSSLGVGGLWRNVMVKEVIECQRKDSFKL